MDYRQELKKLRSKTVLLPDTFAKYGLNVEAVGFSEIQENSFNVLIEVTSKKLSKLKSDIEIIVNAYDEDGQLIVSDYNTLYEEEFDGIDTLSFDISEESILERVSKIKLYAKRS